MSGLSVYLQQKLLDHTLRNTAFTAPTVWKLALFTVAPADDGTGGTEITGKSGYARQSLVFGAASVDTSTTTADVTFSVAGENWGTITAIGIYDAATVGNLLYSAAITPITINTNDQLVISSGGLSVVLA